jgi:hypothetical protein
MIKQQNMNNIERSTINLKLFLYASNFDFLALDLVY